MRHMGQGYKNYVTAALHVMLLGGLCQLVSDDRLVSDVGLSYHLPRQTDTTVMTS